MPRRIRDADEYDTPVSMVRRGNRVVVRDTPPVFNIGLHYQTARNAYRNAQRVHRAYRRSRSWYQRQRIFPPLRAEDHRFVTVANARAERAARARVHHASSAGAIDEGINIPPNSGFSFSVSKNNNNSMNVRDQFVGGFGKAKKIKAKAGKLVKKPSLVKATVQTVIAPATGETKCSTLVFCNLLKIQARTDIARAITRHMVYKLGFSIVQWDVLPTFFPAAYTAVFEATYRTAAGSYAGISATALTTADNWSVWAAKVDFLINSMARGNVLHNIGVRVLNGTNQVDQYKLYCDKSYVHLNQLHVARIQNMSGTEAYMDSRGAVGLVGHQIKGYGAYPVLTDTESLLAAAINLVPADNRVVQVFNPLANAEMEFMKQPVPASLFTNAKYENNFQFEMGKIRTLSLKFNHSYKLSEIGDYWESDIGTSQPVAAELSAKYLNWTVLSMEKAVGSSGEIAFQIETDSYTSAWIKAGSLPAVAVPSVSA